MNQIQRVTSPLTRFWRNWPFSILALIVFFCCARRSVAQEQEEPRRVVILSGANFFIHTSLIQDQAMLQTLMAGSKRQIEFNPEAMDMLRLPSAEYEVEYVAFLKKKYAATKMDLIIAVTSYALNFVERHRDTLWPGSPVVFYNVSEELVRNRAFKPGITGQTIAFDVRGTIELALRLQPEARRLVVVGGVADSDRYWVVRAAEQLRRYTGKVEAVYFTNQPVSQMIADLRQVGRDTIVLFTSTHRDTTGQTYVAQEILTKLSEVSGAPFYGFVANYLGAGIVGGSISSFEEQGRRAGQLALRVLDGENSDTIPVQPPPPSIPTVDWRQLQRWGISESLLPANTQIKYRERSFWEMYRWRIIFAGAVIASQAMLIIGLLVQRRRRHEAEMEVQRERTELAHAARLATAGELTASIAHEISQPLGAILRNAEAAEMLLKHGSPDLGEVRAIVGDICADDHRAAEVINRLRALLKGHSLETTTLAVDSLVADVASLVRSDAKARRVSLETYMPHGLPPVRGDRIHLQQVLLNLILNGMDAVKDAEDERRSVRVAAKLNDHGMVEVAVCDAGQGIPNEKLGNLFKPFFTTKPNGMGMGLSISRTLVEAHGGTIWAENNATHGATFRFTLPTVGGGNQKSRISKQYFIGGQ